MKDYYEILEVNKKASGEMIENAYKTLSKKYKNQNSNEKDINDIVEAYKILSDVFLREQYDLELEKETNLKKKPNKKKTKNILEKNDTEQYNQKIQEPKKKRKFFKEDQFQTAKTMYGLSMDIFRFFKEAIIKLKNKKMEREDWIALGLTAVVVLILGVILWFIPFTNGWVRELTVDNPLITWMYKK